MLNGSSQFVPVAAIDFDTDEVMHGVTCTMTSNRNDVSVQTPSSVHLKRDSSGVTFRCEKEGYRPAEAHMPAHTSGRWTLTAMICPPCVLIDWATGSIHLYKPEPIYMVPDKPAYPQFDPNQGQSQFNNQS